ncbi:unnamed protein product [Peronospora destructor]|uniref:Elicitin n=1 Tax=Peronospora destructor TaxID=86335 RepID=A0AAV0TSX0_9STRA|nr:unnamed protein product [Peronospora destructor]
MKTAFVSAAALVVAAAYSSAATCNLAKIEGLLFSNATRGLANCESATGINIFAVAEFPTSEQVTDLSQNIDCANYLNQINQVANAEIQCNVTIEGVDINFGMLIAEFLSGKTGNESDSGSGSIEIPSASAFGSTELDNAAANSGSTDVNIAAANSGSIAAFKSSASGSHTLVFISSCVAATLALALQ